jgi:hypothetical protein
MSGEQPGVRCGARFSTYAELFAGAQRVAGGLDRLEAPAARRLLA